MKLQIEFVKCTESDNPQLKLWGYERTAKKVFENPEKYRV